MRYNPASLPGSNSSPLEGAPINRKIISAIKREAITAINRIEIFLRIFFGILSILVFEQKG